MLDALERVPPGSGPRRLRIRTDDPIGLSARLRAQAERTLLAGSGWNLKRREVLVVPRAGTELTTVIRHLTDLGIVGARHS